MHRPYPERQLPRQATDYANEHNIKKKAVAGAIGAMASWTGGRWEVSAPGLVILGLSRDDVEALRPARATPAPKRPGGSVRLQVFPLRSEKDILLLMFKSPGVGMTE